ETARPSATHSTDHVVFYRRTKSGAELAFNAGRFFTPQLRLMNSPTTTDTHQNHPPVSDTAPPATVVTTSRASRASGIVHDVARSRVRLNTPIPSLVGCGLGPPGTGRFLRPVARPRWGFNEGRRSRPASLSGCRADQRRSSDTPPAATAPSVRSTPPSWWPGQGAGRSGARHHRSRPRARRHRGRAHPPTRPETPPRLTRPSCRSWPHPASDRQP